MSYDLLPRREADLKDAFFRVAILDESHFIKSHTSQRTKAAEKIFSKSAKRLILLSGTPALSRLFFLVRRCM